MSMISILVKINAAMLVSDPWRILDKGSLCIAYDSAVMGLHEEDVQ